MSLILCFLFFGIGMGNIQIGIKEDSAWMKIAGLASMCLSGLWLYRYIGAIT